MHGTSVQRIARSAPRRCTALPPGRPTPPNTTRRRVLHAALFRPFAKAAFRMVNADLARMEGILAESGLARTVVRPPQLTDKPLTGAGRTAYGQNTRGGCSVPRADVAHHMLGLLEQPEAIHQIIGIAS